MPSTHRLNLLSYLDAHPTLDGPPRHAGPNCAVIGRVTLGRDAWLGAASVIRADGHFVRAGHDLVIGHGATVHIAHDVYPTQIGDSVTIGINAVIHACEVQDGCVVEDGAVVLDGCVIEPGAVLAAGSIVYPRTRLAGGQLYAGRPAKPVGALSADEVGVRRDTLRRRIYGATQDRSVPHGESPRLDETAFVANTATLSGKVIAAAHTSVWYGCELDAAGGELVIGERTNVQDNSILRCTPGARMTLGVDTTIGHNVTMIDCVIGDRSLIGIGSVVAPGTVVEDDVFLAAGASTTPGQRLTSGKLWGGQPARVLGPLDDRKRELIRLTIVTYCQYAEELMRVQKQAATAT